MLTAEKLQDVIKTVQDNLETEAAVKMSLECHQDDDDQDPELERAIRMSLECHEDDADVDMTQLNNRRRCFVLQKREFDRIDEKKDCLETSDA